jgi:DNA polymerase sigma
MGPDKLGPERSQLKESLTDIEDEKLSGDMRELYDRLQPPPESEVRRKKLVEKLNKILNERWPGHSIKVNVFGSTGNKLGTTDSDVDICITTDLKDLERVCCLAELLASHGMERVVCVSSARVPIVKIWDPELRLACDMNVNNPIALENTEMIRTYVDIDPRVRPLAMIIKYWAKRRILNEPGMCDSILLNDLDVDSFLEALGSTLSSYTWICMIINFLQTRKPPILPSLQQQPNLKPKVMNGIDVAFDKDVSLYSGYGSRNKDSLGQLLFQFFRYYGHELDFEKKVISVRLGKVISKVEKGWSFLQDNRLCVEEPFNISRNLGNTADDTSMRGIHLELRRAFEMVAEGNLEKCCEQYEYPVDEGKMSEIFVLPEPRPIVAQMPPPQPASRGRGNGRGGRHTSNRGGSNANRRASSSGTRVHPSLRQFGYQMTPQELQLHAQQQQFLLHDQLFQQYQYLQAQEQELRQQLQQQAFMPGRAATSMAYPHIPFPSYTASDSGHEEANGGRVDALSNPQP